MLVCLLKLNSKCESQKTNGLVTLRYVDFLKNVLTEFDHVLHVIRNITTETIKFIRLKTVRVAIDLL